MELTIIQCPKCKSSFGSLENGNAEDTIEYIKEKVHKTIEKWDLKTVEMMQMEEDLMNALTQ